jgi:transposase InsO family protein
MIEACPGDHGLNYLIHDGDAIYGGAFFRKLEVLELDPMQTAYRSPWQNCYVERVIGTLRRECLNHVVPLNELHLLKVLREFVADTTKRAHINRLTATRRFRETSSARAT